jgi:uncharacterized secreted repeat protein (TIGR03808 family)
MPIDRRTLLKAAAAPAVALAGDGAAQGATPAAVHGLDAAQFGVHSGAAEDQSRALQRAIDQSAQRHAPLWLSPGLYKAAELTLPPGAQIAGVRGQTTLVLSRPGSLLRAERADGVALTGLVFDGAAIASGDRALIVLGNGKSVRIADCDVLRAGATALMLDTIAGAVTTTTIIDAGDTALFSQDARGLLLSGNTIRNAGNGGIRVWQSQKRDDGTVIADNRIDDTQARAGGSGQNGNAINVYRAANVVERGNRIANAAFTAVRGNAANNIAISGNVCTGLGEVALYAEFDFEGAAITGNTVDGAAVGVAVTNFNQGGRLATVQGNLLRNITRRRPAGTDPGDSYGVGIGVEADTAVTGNTIETCSTAGIEVGAGRYQRDIAVTGNVVRNAPFGITVSVSRGAGAAVIAGNVIAGALRGAVVGMNGNRAATGDLTGSAASAYPHITVTGNQVR